jgi:lipoprotein-anchoring transpeptidase ErfK/SrfK
VGVYRGNSQIQSYPVAVGRPGWETPLGEFHVLQMVRNPSWEHPLTHEIFPAGNPGNELGRYWIGFSSDQTGVIGFHGTPHPESVGQSSSHGCVRMHERDIRELFAEVNLGTLVSVVP